MPEQPKAVGRVDKAAEAPAPIPVRAIRIGFYDHTRRRPGDEFLVEDESQLGAWMERLDGGENPAAARAAAAAKPAKKR